MLAEKLLVDGDQVPFTGCRVLLEVLIPLDEDGVTMEVSENPLWTFWAYTHEDGTRRYSTTEVVRGMGELTNEQFEVVSVQDYVEGQEVGGIHRVEEGEIG